MAESSEYVSSRQMVANKCVAHPWECDVMGHLTTRFYMAMFDDASYHFLEKVFGLSPSASGPLGWADVRMVIEYLSEVSAGDLLEIHGSLVKLGGKSVTVRYEMYNRTQDELAATLEVITVLFDMETRRATAFTEAMRESAIAWMSDPD